MDPRAHMRLLPPKGAHTVRQLCTAGRLPGREAVVRRFPTAPLGAALRKV
jgi:hypothetical protein